MIPHTIRLWRLLGSHRVTWILLGMIALAAAAGGSLPQMPRLNSAEVLRLRWEWPVASGWLDRLGLSNVFGSSWFTLLVLALLINLAAGLSLLIARRWSIQTGRETPHWQTSGSGSLPSPPPGLAPGRNVVFRGHAGLWGTVLMHGGIALIVLGGFWTAQSLYAAYMELAIGETYSGQAQKFMTAQGMVMPPKAFPPALRLEELVVTSGGATAPEFFARISHQDGQGRIEETQIQPLHALEYGDTRIYLSNNIGFGALFDRIRADGSVRPTLIKFRVTRAEWSGDWATAREELLTLDGVPLQYGMRFIREGAEVRMDLRVSRGADVIFDGTLKRGERADLGVYQLVFRDAIPWAELYINNDPGRKFVFAGFLVTLAGFLLHLLVPFRRVELHTDSDGWTVRAWTSRNDQRFAKAWQDWLQKVKGTAP